MIRLPLLLLIAASITAVPTAASELVPVPHFRSVELRGGGTLTVVRGPVEKVTILEGSSRFTRFRMDERGDTLKIDACNDGCPRDYRLRVEVQSPFVPDLAVSGGGSVRVADGFAAQQRLATAVRGGGQVDARAVEASNVAAAVKGGGQILVRARSTLAGAVHGGGLIRYWGRPQVTSVTRGGGAVLPGQ